MNQLIPVNLDNGVIQIHPLRTSDLINHDEIVNDLYEIFGDITSIPYNKEKYVMDKKTIINQIFGITLGYQQQIRYTHLLTLKEINKIIGEIIILSPKSVELEYNMKDTWLIEYYLNKQLWNNGIMSGVISAIINNMKSQGITNIGAFVNRDNISSIKVLEKSGFNRITQFDLKQDFYKI